MWVRKTCTGLLAILAIAGPAYAIDYADGATLLNSNKATISNLSNAANGTSETDNNLATIAQAGSGTGHATITFTFPSTTFGAATQTLYLIVDGDVTGTIEARVWEANGSALRGDSVNVSGTGLSDTYFALTFSLTAQTTITSVAVRFSLTTGDVMYLDAVATPEPTGAILFGFGLLALAMHRWRRRRLGLARVRSSRR